MAHSTEQQLEFIEAKISEIRAREQNPKGLYNPINYILEDGGKRIRPMLCVLAGEIYNAPREQTLGAAVAIEVFHNFTLLHDDIMDQAPLRRGRPTAHLKWGSNSAILSGDAMVILAYRLLCESSNSEQLPQLLEVFNKAATEVCEGQQLDMEFEESTRAVSIESYTNMIRLKTSVLLAAALEMGAIAGDATPEDRQLLYDFGVDLGLAFQLQDDLLDTYGDQACFGKSIGGDIAVGKKTFLQITAMQCATPDERAELSTPLNPAAESNKDKYNRVRAIYDKYDVRAKSQCAINEHFNRAMATLERLPVAIERRAPLERYAGWLLGRVK